MTITTDIEGITANAETLRDIVQGASNAPDITTSGGVVQPVAKWQAERQLEMEAIQEPFGPQGAAGPQGDPGPTGATGAAGAAGADASTDSMLRAGELNSFALLRVAGGLTPTNAVNDTRTGADLRYSNTGQEQYSSAPAGTWQLHGAQSAGRRGMIWIRIA